MTNKMRAGLILSVAVMSLSLAGCFGGNGDAPDVSATALPNGGMQYAVTTQTDAFAPIVTAVYAQAAPKKKGDRSGSLIPVGMASATPAESLVLGALANAAGSYAGVGLATKTGSFALNNINNVRGGNAKSFAQATGGVAIVHNP
jgi:hypothetical protein